MQNQTRILLLGASVWLACTSIASPALAVPEISSRPILFIHGFNPLGLPEDCKGVWGDSETQLAASGFTGQMTTVGYYADDTHCDLLSSPKGSILTSIPDLAHDFAWTVYNGWSEKGAHVDIVAHSLGGLIVRYALYRTAVGDSTYPPELFVDHVVTLGSPFTGYSLLAFSCYVNPLNVQCWEMAPYSSFVQGLKASGAVLPEGQGGTLWSNIGSNADVIDSSDGVVGSGSATSMPLPAASKTVIPWYKLVFHTTYYHHSFVISDVATALAQTAESAAAVELAPAVVPAAPDESVCAASSPSSQSTPGTLTAPTTTHFARAELSTDFSRVPSCLRPGKLAPNLVGGEQQGVVVSHILAGGLFDRMGLQNGDVIEGCSPATVNEPLDALDDVLAGQANALSFCVARGGRTLSKQFSVE